MQRRRGIIEVVVPRADRRAMPLERVLRRVTGKAQQVPRVTALLGVDEEGEPLFLRLDSPDVAHVLVAGTTGSGKTVLMRVIGLTLALWNRQRHVQLVLIDPKERGLAPLVGLPHVWSGDVISRPDHVTAALEWLVALMEERDHLGRGWPRVVVLLDELAEVLVLGGKRAQTALTRLVQRGREAGIHLVAATQKPAAAVLGSLMKGNFPVRIVGRVASADDARVAAGLPGTGAERLRGHGEFLLVASGEIIRFLAPYADVDTLQRWVATVREQVRAPRSVGTHRRRPQSQAMTPAGFPSSVGAPPFTPWAWEVNTPTRIEQRPSSTVHRPPSHCQLSSQMLAVWEAAGERLSLTATLRRLGRKPGGAMWDAYRAAYVRATEEWLSSSSSSSSAHMPFSEEEEEEERGQEEDLVGGEG